MRNEELVGTQGEELLQLVCGRLLTRWDFENFAEIGMLPKRIVKKGFCPTHKKVWTWVVEPRMVAGSGLEMTVVRSKKQDLILLGGE